MPVKATPDEYTVLCRVRLEHLVEVREPLVLVSQIQRSGGTLLSQLFDGHPECHADPFELKIGHPRKSNWPRLDLGRPDSWFDVLSDPGLAERLHPSERTRKPERGRSVFPCLFLTDLQRQIFDTCVAARAPETERDVLDCYFTSYFNAWVDNQNLYARPKSVVTGFVARLSTNLENVERFFAAYPDGTLISIVREPRAWFASASRHKQEYEDIDHALGLWRESASAALGASERWGDRVLVLTYEELVEDTKSTMQHVAKRIGIPYATSLLMPTFNGRPIRANSSFPVDRYGVLPERAVASDSAEAARIDELAGDLYERARSSAVRA